MAAEVGPTVAAPYAARAGGAGGWAGHRGRVVPLAVWSEEGRGAGPASGPRSGGRGAGTSKGSGTGKKSPRWVRVGDGGGIVERDGGFGRMGGMAAPFGYIFLCGGF